MLNLDPITRDLVITAGQFTEVSGLEAVGQRIRNRINVFTLEWFLDLGFGLPYLDEILGKVNPNMVVVAAIYKREIRKSLEGEAVLTSLSAKFESATRVLTVSMLVTAPDGVTLEENFIL